MASYGRELLLDSYSRWSGISNHLSSFSILLPWSSRSKGLHWWRRSKSYKLHMELHQSSSWIPWFSNCSILWYDFSLCSLAILCIRVAITSIRNQWSPKRGGLLSLLVTVMIQGKETKVKAIGPHHISHVFTLLKMYLCLLFSNRFLCKVFSSLSPLKFLSLSS